MRRRTPSRSRDPHHVLVVHVAAPRKLRRQDDAAGALDAREPLPVERRDRAAALVPGRQTRKLRAEHGRLDRVEAEVAADALVDVRLRRAVDAEVPDERGERVVVRRHRAGVPGRAEVLRRIEGERAEVPEGPRGAAARRRPDRLTRVLQDGNPPRPGDREDRRPCRRTGRRGARARSPSCAASARPRDARGSSSKSGGLDVDEDRPRAEPRHDPGGGEERERRGDDLVAGSDAERHQGDQQRVGARRDADDVPAAEERGERPARTPRPPAPGRSVRWRRPRRRRGRSPPSGPRRSASGRGPGWRRRMSVLTRRDSIPVRVIPGRFAALTMRGGARWRRGERRGPGRSLWALRLMLAGAVVSPAVEMPNLSGNWQLNKDASDDSGKSDAGGARLGGGSGGGLFRRRHGTRGRHGGGGGGGGRGSGRGDSGDASSGSPSGDSPRSRRCRSGTRSRWLSITDAAGHERVLYTDGRKTEEEHSHGGTTAVTAAWKDGHLEVVVEARERRQDRRDVRRHRGRLAADRHDEGRQRARRVFHVPPGVRRGPARRSEADAARAPSARDAARAGRRRRLRSVGLARKAPGPRAGEERRASTDAAAGRERAGRSRCAARDGRAAPSEARRSPRPTRRRRGPRRRARWSGRRRVAATRSQDRPGIPPARRPGGSGGRAHRPAPAARGRRAGRRAGPPTGRSPGRLRAPSSRWDRSTAPRDR